MKKTILSLFLWSGLMGGAMAATPYPQFPSFDPFVNAAGTNGGSSYAAGSTLAGQTNAMGQYWYAIDSTGTVANSVTNTGYPLSYQGLPGFSGNEILLRNLAGPGARMFVTTNSTATSANTISGVGTNFYYSVVMQVSNITSLSTTGDFLMGVGDQGTVGTQTSQPGTIGAVLWIKKVNTTNFVLGIMKVKNGATVEATNWSSTILNTNQAYLVVVDYEILLAPLNPGGKAGDNVNLWINPATNTFGAPTEPAADTSIISTGNGFTTFISCVQIYNQATDTPNDVYMTDFRMGTNWGWTTGGPGIGAAPIASTNTPTGVLNLNVTAMQNGTPNTYNWQLNGTNLANGASISGSGATVSGATNAALTISGMDTSLTQLDSGNYTVVVSNAYGAVTSSVCAVTAYSSPVITAQPAAANLALYAGETANLSVAAVGFSPVYYWYTNNMLDTAATNSSFAFSNVQADASIYAVVSNSIGATNSAVVSVKVVPLPSAPYPLAVYNDHPIGFWPLSEVPDNNSGDDGVLAYDYIDGNNGFYSNVTLGLSGYGPALAAKYSYSPATDTNSAAQFGYYAYPNSYVAQIPNINFGTTGTAGSFSVEAWANGIITGNGTSVINKGWGAGGEQFTLDSTAGWRFYVRNAAGTTSVALATNAPDNNWHHLAGVVDAAHGEIYLYVDGMMQASASFTASGGLLLSTNEMVIGSRMSGQSTAFDDNFAGQIQDVAVYNYALTPAQVAGHFYAAGIGPIIVGLPSSVNVNEGSTLTVALSVIGSTPLTNVWTDTTASSPIAGQTNSTLVISNISFAAYNGHNLQLTVSDAYGQASASVNVSVASGQPGSIAVTPSSLSVYAGSSLSFSVTAQGTTPFSYQWSTNGGAVPGATSSVLSVSLLPPGSYSVTCAVGNSYGTNSSSASSLTVVSAPSDNYGAAILSAGPVAFWRLDEAAGATTAFDYVGGHNAAYQNALNGQPGFNHIGEPSETSTVFGFNGVTPSEAEEQNNTGAGIPMLDFSAQGANGEFSVEAWVQVSPQSTDILNKGYPNNTQFALDLGGTGGSFRLVVHNSADTIFTVNSGSLLPDGNWHHIVGVCDEAGGAIRIYGDGVLKNSSTITSGSGLLALSSSYPVVIAAQESSGGGFTSMSNAAISQVALYSYAMTSNQVAAHYNAGIALPSLASFNITSWTYLSGTSITLNWQSVPNYTYQVQAVATLPAASNAWKNLGSPITATGTNTSYTDTSTNSAGAAGYFRVVGY